MSAFEAILMPEDMRLELARSLLAEAGVDRVITNTATKELTHCCAMPWHDDRNPSASLNYESLTYWCFSCRSGGGLLWLIRVIRGGSHAEARRWVEDESGISGGEYDLGSVLQYIDALYAGDTAAAPTTPRFSPRALDPWAFIHPWLTDPPDEFGRGIPEDNVVRMRVGYAHEYPMGEGQPTSERIVVPHFWQGDLLGWQSRRLADDGTPKWISTPDFPRDRTLYGDVPEVERSEVVVVVESPMTVLRHLHHLPILATFGADMTGAQARALAQWDRVVMWPDPDLAGWRALEGYTDDSGQWRAGAIDRLENYTDVWVANSDWAVDGAELDDDAAQAVVESAEPAVLWERPSALRCWDCKEVHTGECGEEV